MAFRWPACTGPPTVSWPTWRARAASARRTRRRNSEPLRQLMRKRGSRRSRRRRAAERLALGAVLAWAVGFAAARAEGLRPFTVAGDAIQDSLTGAPGDPA